MPADGNEVEGPVTVVADTSEPAALLELVRARGVPVERRRLAPADYVVGAVAFERKTVRDFYSSIVRKRLFEQLVRLKEAYPPPVVLLLEGDLAWAATLAEPRPFWGALASAAVDVGVAVLPTPDAQASAEVLALVARRMGAAGRGSEVRFKPRLLGPTAAQEFAVQGLPGIGDVTSASLLERFGSVRRVFAASGRELLKVPGVGKKRAAAIEEFLERPYAGRQARLPREAASPEGEDADG